MTERARPCQLIDHLGATLRERVRENAARRQMAPQRWVEGVLREFLADERARTSGRGRPEPPRPPDRSLVVLYDPEGRIRDPRPGRQWQDNVVGETGWPSRGRG